MPKKDKRIDTFISKSANFAKPILIHLRKLVHEACPEVEETMKWSFPHFDYKGSMCHMASFKQHCTFGFWKAALMKDSDKLLEVAKSEVAMGHFGKITSLKDLPKDAVIIKYVKEAAKLNELNIKLPTRKTTANKEELNPHPDFLKAVSKNKKALKVYEEFSYSNKKEYVMWINEAKTEATRDKRIVDAVQWMSEGKIRNWKYLK